MYPSIENLLKIRDGEPVDADALAYVDADPSARAELARLREAQRELRDLPRFEPPAGVWERVIEAVDEEATLHARRRWEWPLRGAIAASVAVLAMTLIARSPEAPLSLEPAPATIVGETPPNNRIEDIVGTPSYASLIAESVRLDRTLNSLPYRPTVMRAGTVSTIAAYEDQIAVIDDRLMFANRLGLSPQQRESLWQMRVDLMTALIHLRYSQAQR